LDSINCVNEEKGQRKRGKEKEFNDTVTMEGFIKQEKKKNALKNQTEMSDRKRRKSVE
jgi:hypothetical protein